MNNFRTFSTKFDPDSYVGYLVSIGKLDKFSGENLNDLLSWAEEAKLAAEDEGLSTEDAEAVFDAAFDKMEVIIR